MPSPAFPPRPAPQDDPYAAARGHPRAPPNARARPYGSPNESPRTPRGILRTTTPSSHIVTPNNPTANPQIARPLHPPIPRSTTTTSPYHHHHTSSSPELRPRVDNAWAPRARPSDLSQANAPSPSHAAGPPPRGDQDDAFVRRSGFTARINPHFVPGIRGRSASDVRIAHTPPPDLDPDRLARACGQPAPSNVYRHDHRGGGGGQTVPIDTRSSRLHESSTARTADVSLSHPPIPKVKIGLLYRRLDALARRLERRAMDYVSYEDVLGMHKRDGHIREQLRRKRSDRLQDKDPSFHAIGAPLEDVVLYASTPIIIGDYSHHLPVVVVACIEELTKTGIYQSGLFRALPHRDRHLQLIDLFDKSSDFGAYFSLRGQEMPDVCALLSTFISSLPAPLFDAHIYSAFLQWCVKPSAKREDVRRDQQEEEEEERRARGEPTRWTPQPDLYLDDADSALETEQVFIAQILLRFLPSVNLSLLVYLCGFFTQLPLCPENGLQLEDVARIFGHRLLGGSAKQVSQRMMMWLLTRWHRISETLFGEMCGMSPQSSPRNASPLGNSGGAVEGSRERIEKRKGKRESGSGDALRHAASSSSSHSSASTESPSDAEGEGESSGSSRRRKKRELNVQDPRSNPNGQSRHRSSTRKARHGRHGSGSRRHHHHHHHAHSSEHKRSPTSPPDPFAVAFAKAQRELADSPLLANPSSTLASGERSEEQSELAARFEARPNQRFDTPVRIARYEIDAQRTDMCVVDALLQETAVATDVARALAERVEVLERELHGRDKGERQAGHRRDASRESGGGLKGGGEREGGRGNGDKDVEDDWKAQMRHVEVQERDEARRIVRDVRAYLLEEGLTFRRG